ncbi:MAG TPA: biotin transporter BioY [Homoserinimonas sp.]|nr:biotin transporter BioY [Homoserinimonas sp.]
MSRVSLPLRQPTLADRLLGRGFGVDIVLIFTGVALVSIAAQVAIPHWPIPITGQSIAVLLTGIALGPLRGAIAMALYAVGGAAGLPIFSFSSSGFDSITGQTGGYIIGFIGAAALVGWLAQRGWDRTPLRSIAAAAGGTAVIYLFGLPGLAIARSLSLEETLEIGLYPLIVASAVELLIVAAVNTAAWAAIARMEKRDEQRAARAL